jgi:phosphatidylinositol kinase/protein kinase (PI-3  family)
MTADMVDGMGTTGTQGVFQRCAEETLRVLRNDSEVVLTVLEVFKYDPLHSWCVHRRSRSCPCHLLHWIQVAPHFNFIRLFPGAICADTVTHPQDSE